MDIVSAIFFATYDVIAESALWLLIGFFLAGLIHVLLPEKYILQHLSRPGLYSILKAAFVGVPLPLCSCSVIPVAFSLRRSGAGSGASLSFLTSTPQIGVDSFFLTWGMLGPLTAWVRVIAAFISSVLVGLIGDKLSKTEAPVTSKLKSCNDENSATLSMKEKFVDILRYAFIVFVDDLSLSLLAGFFSAGLAFVLIPDNWFSTLNAPTIVFSLVMLAISFPTYICALASTPMAAVLLAKGVPVGAVIVFLIAGPASNVATIVFVSKEFGRLCAFSYIACVSVVALIVGEIANFWVSTGGEPFLQEVAAHVGHSHGNLLDHLAAISVCLLLIASQARTLRRKHNKRDTKSCCH